MKIHCFAERVDNACIARSVECDMETAAYSMGKAKADLYDELLLYRDQLRRLAMKERFGVVENKRLWLAYLRAWIITRVNRLLGRHTYSPQCWTWDFRR